MNPQGEGGQRSHTQGQNYVRHIRVFYEVDQNKLNSMALLLKEHFI